MEKTISILKPQKILPENLRKIDNLLEELTKEDDIERYNFFKMAHFKIEIYHLS